MTAKKRKILGFCPMGTGMGDPFTDMFDEVVNLHKTNVEVEDLGAVVLWGGEDIATSLYGQKVGGTHGPYDPTKRDMFEWEVMRRAAAAKVPIIGVCRGAQIATAFAGGSLIQDVSGHHGGHDIETSDGKLIYTNSAHHQMMNPYELDEDSYELLAWSKKNISSKYVSEDRGVNDTYLKDGTAFSSLKEPEIVVYHEINCLAIQGHPEWLGPTAPLNLYVKQVFKDMFM